MHLLCLEDVAKNNGQNGSRIWVVINKNVYDLTDYVKQHPGGDELILEFAGKDGTRDFNNFGHSSDAKTYMKKYKIGELAEDCYKKSKKANKVAEELPKSENKTKRSIMTKFWLCS